MNQRIHPFGSRRFYIQWSITSKEAGAAPLIRKRKPSRDDGTIYRLVVDELLPFTASVEKDSVNLKEIKNRLKEGTTFVASNPTGGRPYGFIHLVVRDQILFVDMLAITKDFQGQGWGTRLMEKGEKYGRSQGCVETSLFVDQSNPKARKFYEKQGYRYQYYIPGLSCAVLSKPLAEQ